MSDSKVDYEKGNPSGILVTCPMWYGHINYTFFCWNGQWYYEKATHEFGIAGRKEID